MHIVLYRFFVFCFQNVQSYKNIQVEKLHGHISCVQEKVPNRLLFYFGILGYIFILAVEFLRASLIILEYILL